MRKAALIWIGLIASATSAAVADTSQDCAQNRDQDLLIVACSEIIGHGGNVAWAYYNRGNAHRAKGENDRAIADYTRAIEINPKHANAFISRGMAYHAKGENDRAIADYTMAIVLNPKDVWAYYNRGNAHRAKGENDLAIADYTRAIEINPKHANAFNNRGIAYAALGKREEAIADCRRALAIDRAIQESKDTLKRLGAPQ
jgi:tetratricopeptide (TPR) repeat protein